MVPTLLKSANFRETRMRVRTDPLTLAVALGLLGPTALQEGGMLEVHPDDAEELVRMSTDVSPGASAAADVAAGLTVAPDVPETVSYEVNLDGPEMGAAEE